MPHPSVAVVIPVHGRLPLTLRFIESFRQVRYAPYQLIIVDDGSPDDTTAVLAREHPEIILLRGDGNLWWAGATNLGVRFALEQGFDYVLTINNDAVVSTDFLERLVATAQDNPASIVGCRINYKEPVNRVWGVGGYTDWENTGFPLQLHDYGCEEREVLRRRPNPFPVELLTGCGTLVPVACYQDVGLYDARMFPQYHADAEFTLRAARQGYPPLVDLHAVIWNDEPQTCTVRNLLVPRSPWYWRPLLALHLRHCPSRYRFESMSRQFGDTIFNQIFRGSRLARLGHRLLRKTG
jgi:GT2 family glycosyltransferase